MRLIFERSHVLGTLRPEAKGGIEFFELVKDCE